MTTEFIALPETRHDAESTVEVGGMNIAIRECGSGSALVFVHTGFSSFMWQDLMDRLSEGYRCISIDAPGTGGSSGTPTLEHSARAIVGVIDALDLSSVTLVMHDLGGIAALAAASRRSDRIEAIVAINTFAWRPRGALRAMLSVIGSPLMTSIDVRTRLVSRLTASGFGTGRRSGPSRREAVERALDGAALRTFHAYMRDARREMPIYDEIARALRGSLRTMPVVTIFGEKNDPFHFQRGWKEIFPGAWQVVVPGGNHFPMCDDPKLVAETIDAFHRSLKEN